MSWHSRRHVTAAFDFGGQASSAARVQRQALLFGTCFAMTMVMRSLPLAARKISPRKLVFASRAYLSLDFDCHAHSCSRLQPPGLPLLCTHGSNVVSRQTARGPLQVGSCAACVLPEIGAPCPRRRNLRAQPATLPNNDSRCRSQNSVVVVLVFVW